MQNDLLARHKERLERTNRLFGLSEDQELLLGLIEALEKQEQDIAETRRGVEEVVKTLHYMMDKLSSKLPPVSERKQQ